MHATSMLAFARSLLLLLGALGFAITVPAAGVEDTAAFAEIATLRREIARHDQLYFRDAAPEITDAAYDALRRKLTELEQRHPEAARRAPPLAAVGDDRSGQSPTHPHLVPMLSLEKAYRPADLSRFHAFATNRLAPETPSFVVEPKYDGVAISLVFERGKLVRALTRGDGHEGEDVTAQARLIDPLPALHRGAADSRQQTWPELVEIRGEVWISFSDFARVNRERESRGEPLFATPRNLAAGTLRQSDLETIRRRGLQLVCFGVGAWRPDATQPASHRELLRQLDSWGFAVPSVIEARSEAELRAVIEDAAKVQTQSPFPIDGVVIKLDARSAQAELGVGEQAPRWAMAYKFASARAETRVRSITLHVGRTGVITPVAELEPVMVGGVVIARATLHNAAEIARLDIRVGDTVWVERAGEVIPAIVGVNHARRTDASAPFRWPATCPGCSHPLQPRVAEAVVRCENAACGARLRRRIEHFVSRGCLDISGLGPVLIDRLVSAGVLRDLPDLFRLSQSELMDAGGLSERSADRLLARIATGRRAELWRLIHGLGLPQVGARGARDLARKFGSLGALAHDGPKAVAALREPHVRALLDELVGLGVDPRPPGPSHAGIAAEAHPLAGRTVVLTGALRAFTRAQALARVEAFGGRVATSITSRTDFLVAGMEPGAKLEQARARGVVVLDEPAFLALLEPR